jgi:hypothetical protein
VTLAWMADLLPQKLELAPDRSLLIAEGYSENRQTFIPL